MATARESSPNVARSRASPRRCLHGRPAFFDKRDVLEHHDRVVDPHGEREASIVISSA